MNYLYAMCLVNAALLVVVASLLWSASRHTARRDATLASELTTLQAFLQRTADGYAGELRRLEGLTDGLRIQERRRDSRPDTPLPLTQMNRLASTAASAHELAELTGLGRAEAELLMGIRTKGAAIAAENPHADR